jgi:hypothetical protein
MHNKRHHRVVSSKFASHCQRTLREVIRKAPIAHPVQRCQYLR